jgi:hypothetical protein
MQAQPGARGCGVSGATGLDSVSGISSVIHAGIIRSWCPWVVPDGPLVHRATGGDHSFIAAGGNLPPLLPLALQLVE